MKKILLYLFFIFATQVVVAQTTNSIKVNAIIKPDNNTIYGPNDSIVFIISITNEGPNDLIAGDQYQLNYNLANNSGTGIDFDTLLKVGSPTLRPGQTREYVVDSALKFNGSDIYSICADLINGTVLMPINPLKFSGKCKTFTVNVEEVNLKVDQLYYAQGYVNFKLNQTSDYTVEIFDITGKLLKTEFLQNLKNHKLKLPTTTKGFYFLKVADHSGKSTTSKFVVH